MKQILFMLLLWTVNYVPDCTTDKTECFQNIEKGFNFLKDYSFAAKASSYTEVSYVLTKDTQYNFKLCSENLPGTSLEIFNSNRKIIASSDAIKVHPFSLNLLCGATGIYYIRFKSKVGADCCATGILSFKR